MTDQLRSPRREDGDRVEDGHPPMSQHPPRAPGTTPRRTVVWLAVLAVALLVVPTVGAAVWSSREPATYAAEIDLLHVPSGDNLLDSVDRQLATHQVLLLRQPLLDDAAASVGRDREALAAATSVDVVEASSILRLRIEDRDADRARLAAAYIADRYVRISDSLAATSNIGRVRTVSPARVLDDPVGPQPFRAAAAGALFGLVLVVALAGLLRLRTARGGRPGT